MLRELRIGSYRGLHGITLPELGQINMIIGENNSGKTSVLEAIQLLNNSVVPSNVISIARRRESQLGLAGGRNRLLPFDMLLYSFPMQQVSYKEIFLEAQSDKYGYCMVKICGELRREWLSSVCSSRADMERYESLCDEDGMVRELEGEYIYEYGNKSYGKFYFNEAQRTLQLLDENGEVRKYAASAGNIVQRKVQYISTMDIYTNRIISASLYKGMLVEEKQRLLELLQMFDERIIGVEKGVQYGNPITYIEMEDCGLVPVSIFGDGLKKVLTLASAIVRMRGGIILIDEFETGIHKHALMQVAKWLAAVTRRYDVQVFLTTHNSDAIEALVEAQDDSENINAYRLEHYKSNIYVKKFQGADLYNLKINQGMDIL